jgi:cephalosporin hydroxylase
MEMSKALVRNYWKSIPGNMFDFRAYYEEMALKLPHRCRIVEVGVADGKSAICLAESLLNQAKTFEMFMIDNCGYGGPDQRNEIMRNIQRAGVSEYVTFLDMDSLAASCKFNDHSLNFVFLDSSHRYEETKAEIRLWYRKLLDGSTLAGHDYFSQENAGVRMAVDEIIPLEHLVTQQTENKCGVWSVVKNPHVRIK